MSIPTVKKDNRGGARPGAGRKPETLTADQVGKMLRKAKKWARKHEKTIDDIILAAIYGLDFHGKTVEVPANVQFQYVKLWKDLTVPKITEGGQTDKSLGPSVFLPEHRATITAIN